MKIMKQKPQLVERRKFLRIPSEDVLNCKVFSVVDLVEEVKGYEIQAIMKNISAGGVLFESNSRYEVGSILKLSIDVKGWENFKPEFFKGDVLSRKQPLVVLANVVRVEVVEPYSKYDIGVCFSAIDEGHRWAMIKYVDRKVKEKTVF